jgi:hypothetical protein
MRHLATFDTAGGRRVGTVVKSNPMSVWVKLMIGAKSYKIIKRHVKKHNIVFSITGV